MSGYLGARPSFGYDAAMGDHIDVLEIALSLAVGELSTHSEYSVWSPDQLRLQFIEEAVREIESRRGE